MASPTTDCRVFERPEMSLSGPVAPVDHGRSIEQPAIRSGRSAPRAWSVTRRVSTASATLARSPL